MLAHAAAAVASPGGAVLRSVLMQNNAVSLSRSERSSGVESVTTVRGDRSLVEQGVNVPEGFLPTPCRCKLSCLCV